MGPKNNAYSLQFYYTMDSVSEVFSKILRNFANLKSTSENLPCDWDIYKIWNSNFSERDTPSYFPRHYLKLYKVKQLDSI